MIERHADSTLNIDADRWYYTQFRALQYRQSIEWTELHANFERTAEAIKTLLNAYQTAGVFGDAELTALKSVVQVSHVIGVEKTQNQIHSSAGPEDQLKTAADLVAEGTGIVGGTAYHASVNGVPADTTLGIFATLLDEDAETSAVETAATDLLALDFENIGGGTLTPLLCLLRPTQFPIINQQSVSVFDSCFDIELSASPEAYLESAAQFDVVRDEFGFDDHFRQLDYFCYWLREEAGVQAGPFPDDFSSRDVWQINVAEYEFLWPVWQELGICSIGWDVGPLDELPLSEIEEKADQWDSNEVADYLRRFSREIEPGQVIIAKDGQTILGIGVTKDSGYHYCGEFVNRQIDETDISQPHVWPVDWQVIPDTKLNRDVNKWGLTTSLQARKTLVTTGAFEGIRWQLAKQAPALSQALADLESLSHDPPTADLPAPCQRAAESDSVASDAPGGYFIFQTGDDVWEDEHGKQYHCLLGNPGTRALWEAGTARIVYMENGELYATARVTDIERSEGEDDGETHLYAFLEDYEELEPIDITEIRPDLETSFSRQHSIIELTERDFQYIVDQGTTTRYFWVNTASDDWLEEGGEAFYKTTNGSGVPRNNQEVYGRIRPSDKVLVYRNAPTQAIVGEATVTAGLHTESVESREEPAEGVTLAWERSLDAVSWSDIKAAPAFEDSPVVTSGNSYVITELTEAQYETVYRLAGEGDTNYFWASANPSLWDIEAAETGNEIFYTARTEQGRSRNQRSAFSTARPGDSVLFYKSSPVRQIVGEGTVVSSLHKEQPDGYDEPVEGVTLRYEKELQPVDWATLTDLPELSETAVMQTNARGALFELPADAYDAIQAFAADSEPDPQLVKQQVETLRTRLSPPEVSIDLPDGLYFEHEADLKRQIEASLNSGKHIIFTGPPGTGKTKLAKHISEQVTDDHPEHVDGYTFTTATAEWTTFDTIGGYTPNRSAEGDELVFQPRMFLNCFREDGQIQNEWLVIDEINRSDIDKAFGQLFSVLSGDSVELPYERESAIELVPLEEGNADETTDDDQPSLTDLVTDPDTFPVTPSWRLLATMNTYDKTSLYELSYAFMRRFNFIHVGVPPLRDDNGAVRTSLLNPAKEKNYGTEWAEPGDPLRAPLEATYEQLAVIWAIVNDHQTIGPSIVRDMLGYLAASGQLDEPGPALTDVVIALIFPQLEGMAPQEQWNLVDALTDDGVETESGPVDLKLDSDRLERKAKDFFDLPPRADE